MLTTEDTPHESDSGDFHIVARLVDDWETQPSDYGAEVYSAEDFAAFERGDRCYVGITVTVYLRGVELGAASLWAIDYIGQTDEMARYLEEIEADLTAEALTYAREELRALAAIVNSQATREEAPPQG